MKTYTLIQFNRQWSSWVFKAHEAMTKDEFLVYAQEFLFGEASEGLYENIAQAQSEINAFGDSGPGTMLALREHINLFNNVADQYTKLTNRPVRRPTMSYHP
ncbi:hypothetical protein [Acinetobacter sp.]|uniref:hypothetical protein n=1 Tax=Acinetobacter sp. TaxID=472 RepID=UPI00388E2EFB